MRVLIVHLSDFHIKAAANCECDLQVAELRRALGDLGAYDGLMIAFTGDAANSGSEEEYAWAKSVFNKVIDALSDGFDGEVGVFLVPGNHDLAFPEGFADSGDDRVLKGKSLEVLADVAKTQLGWMAPFHEWASGYGCDFAGAQVASKLFRPAAGATGAPIRVTMVNTVPVSMPGASSDKHYHWVGEADIARIRCGEDNGLHVVMLHHGPEWLAEALKRPMVDALCSSADILMIGHEHVDGAFEMTDQDGRPLLVMEGGKARLITGGEFTFSALDVDMASYPYKAVEMTYEWVPKTQYFAKAHSEKPYEIRPKRGALVPREGFLNNVQEAGGDLIVLAPFMDYFVFPPLTSAADLETGRVSRIDSFEGFYEAIEGSERICIRGRGNSGKSTLVRALYLKSFQEGFVPLCLSPDRSQPSMTKMFENLVEEQYGKGDAIAHAFDAVPRARKILFIDDFARLRKRKKDNAAYLDELLTRVGKVVFTAPDSTISDAIADASESVKRQLGFGDAVVEYTIGDFLKSKREELVRSVCKVEGASGPVRDRLVIVVNQMATVHRGMFESTPDFIIHYAKYLLAHSEAMSASDVVPMAQLYESNISDVVKKALNRISGGQLDRYVQRVMVILDEIAYSMHAAKSPVASMGDVARIVSEYKEAHAVDLDLGMIVDAAREARILVLDRDGDLRFATANQLAFFVARKLQREVSGGKLGDELTYLLDNICFDINERILLFLAYLRDNDELPLELCERLETMLGGIADVDFASQALSFLSVDAGFEVGMVDPADFKKRAKAADEAEAHFAERESFEYDDLYDYDEGGGRGTAMVLASSLKYLEMLGRSYVAQFVHSGATTKEFIRDSLFSGSGKILGATLERLGDRFDDVVDAMWETFGDIAAEQDAPPEVERDDVVRFVRGFTYIFCIAVLDAVAYSCSEADTVDFLDGYEGDGVHVRILKMCMYENALVSDDFIDRLCSNSSTDGAGIIERNLLMLVANKRIANHPGIRFNDIDRISQKVFGNNAAKKGHIVGKVKALGAKKKREGADGGFGA